MWRSRRGWNIKMEFAIYTDGGCIGNKRDSGCPGAYAYIILDESGSEIINNSGLRENVTNNQMELLAVIAGSKKLMDYTNKFHGISKKHSVIIYTDSKYVCDNFSDYLQDWKKNGWKKSNRSPVVNVEYWKKLDHLSSEFQSFRIRWVKGHASNEFNVRADAMVQKRLSKR